MKVVEGNFGQTEADEDRPTLGESLSEVLTVCDLKDMKDANFVLIVDTDKRTSFMTNQRDPAAALYLLEQIKFAIVSGGIDRID